MTIRNAICYLTLAYAPAVVTAQSPRQPDEALYKSGVADVQDGRYERARLTLQTLINTYDTSPLLQPAKVTMADSWFRQGGARGLAQSEKLCKDVIAQAPDSPSATEARQLMRKIQDARK